MVEVLGNDTTIKKRQIDRCTATFFGRV